MVVRSTGLVCAERPINDLGLGNGADKGLGNNLVANKEGGCGNYD